MKTSQMMAMCKVPCSRIKWEKMAGQAYRKSGETICSQSHWYGYGPWNAVCIVILIQERDQDAPALGKGLNDGK